MRASRGGRCAACCRRRGVGALREETNLTLLRRPEAGFAEELSERVLDLVRIRFGDATERELDAALVGPVPEALRDRLLQWAVICDSGPKFLARVEADSVLAGYGQGRAIRTEDGPPDPPGGFARIIEWTWLLARSAIRCDMPSQSDTAVVRPTRA